MKILIYLLAVNSILLNVNAQVKIGAPGDPDINAVLELAGSSKGLLLPRLALAGLSNPAPLSTFTAGMVIYNTANVSDVRPGYYYSDGIKWIRTSNSLETWSLTGNAATNPAVQYIGTSDSTDLSIRTNNTERMRIYSNGTCDIGINGLPGNVRIRMGGTASGHEGATLGLNGTLNATANGQVLSSIFNNPSFGTGFTHSSIHGMLTSISFSGLVSALITGNSASVSVTGSNSQPGSVIGIRGSVTRSSTGIGVNGSFYGGDFSVSTSGLGSGTILEMFGTSSTASLLGTGATQLTHFGAQDNIAFILNPNATTSAVYGIRNTVQHAAGTILGNVYAIQNSVGVFDNSRFSNAYGSVTSFQTVSGGGFTNCYGHYVAPVSMTDNITNYTGILIGNISLTSGQRRVFEYAGVGSNDPVIINYDGSVQIGTNFPVTNAKLSIVDGHLQSGQTTKPLITASANIGTGGTASLNDATDVAGIITIDLGTGNWNAGNIATVTFNKTYVNPPIVVLTPSNFNSAVAMNNQLPYVTRTATSFTINFALPATNGSVLTFNYHVIETMNN